MNWFNPFAGRSVIFAAAPVWSQEVNTVLALLSSILAAGQAIQQPATSRAQSTSPNRTTEIVMCRLAPPNWPPGADGKVDLEFSFVTEGTHLGSVRRTSRPVVGVNDDGVPGCVSNWRFYGWSAGVKGRIRFHFSHETGWEYMEVTTGPWRQRIYYGESSRGSSR